MTSTNETANGSKEGAGAERLSDGTEGFIAKPTVAQRMSKCTRTIDNLMGQGLPHYKIGRSVIFRWSEIEAYLAANHRVSHRNGAH